jgi:hypothetical protein
MPTIIRSADGEALNCCISLKEYVLAPVGAECHLTRTEVGQGGRDAGRNGIELVQAGRIDVATRLYTWSDPARAAALNKGLVTAID